MFSVTKLTIKGDNIIFITKDKAMLLAAAKANSKLNILKTEEFKEKYLT